MAENDQLTAASGQAAIQYQGIGIRFVSYLIDSIILGLLIGVLGSILGYNNMSGTAGWVYGILFFIIYLGYFSPIWKDQEARRLARWQPK